MPDYYLLVVSASIIVRPLFNEEEIVFFSLDSIYLLFDHPFLRIGSAMNFTQRFLQRMRLFSKRVINPRVLKFAGSPHSLFAVVQHVGRRSGRAYETPLLVMPVADSFVIELTYGLEVDWYRNVVAAGECRVLWRGREYICDEFGPIEVEIALPAFPLALRLPLQLLGARHFVRMKSRLVASRAPG